MVRTFNQRCPVNKAHFGILNFAGQIHRLRLFYLAAPVPGALRGYIFSLLDNRQIQTVSPGSLNQMAARINRTGYIGAKQ